MIERDAAINSQSRVIIHLVGAAVLQLVTNGASHYQISKIKNSIDKPTTLRVGCPRKGANICKFPDWHRADICLFEGDASNGKWNASDIVNAYCNCQPGDYTPLGWARIKLYKSGNFMWTLSNCYYLQVTTSRDVKSPQQYLNALCFKPNNALCKKKKCIRLHSILNSVI